MVKWGRDICKFNWGFYKILVEVEVFVLVRFIVYWVEGVVINMMVFVVV